MSTPGTVYYVTAGLAGRYPAFRQPRRTVKGAELVGLRYVGPVDDLPVQRGVEHRVIPWEEVSAQEAPFAFVGALVVGVVETRVRGGRSSLPQLRRTAPDRRRSHRAKTCTAVA